MTTAFQANAFQLSTFQIDVVDAADSIGSANQTVGEIIQIARGKRDKNWPRLGPIPDHDTDYVRWLATKQNP